MQTPTPFLFFTLSLLLAPLSNAVHNGYIPSSSAEVPYSAGFLLKLDESESPPAYKDCLSGHDDTLTSFCSGGLISEGVFLTAAHCFENRVGVSQADIKANPEAYTAVSDGSADLGKFRVGLGAKIPYRNDDGTCTGNLRTKADNIYKVKAVFIHKDFRQISQSYTYDNPRTNVKGNTGTVELDHMDVAVVLLDECASDVDIGGVSKPRYGKIAGGLFQQLNLMWSNFDSKTNTGGLPGTLWGYGDSEDDTETKDANNKLVPKPIHRANWNFIRGTSPPSVANASQRKVWANCDWLPDATEIWDFGRHTYSQAYTAASNSVTNMKATPHTACTPRNPNDKSIKSRCADQTTSASCTNKKTKSGKTYCSWSGSACAVNDDAAGGIGMATYPSTGGGDSGGAVWYVEKQDKLGLHDRAQLVGNLVHIGIAYAATTFYPDWDQIIRTDYLQNWLANVIDRDSCATKRTKEYFDGFDDSAAVVGVSSSSPPVTQSGWHLSNHYVGMVKGQSGVGGLSLLPKRGNAGDWSSSNLTSTTKNPNGSNGGTTTTSSASSGIPTTSSSKVSSGPASTSSSRATAGDIIVVTCLTVLVAEFTVK